MKSASIYTKALSIFCLLHIWAITANAQTPKYNLMGEGNGNTVKLFWLPNQWEKNVIGFDVQRRAINNGKAGNWVTVNSKRILPESDPDKNLEAVEPNEAERQKLRTKLQMRIANGNAKIIPYKDYLDKLRNDTAAIKALLLPFSLDYDFALVNGFGLVDRNIPQAQEYEYGLFPAYSGNANNATPVATFKWKYGAKPNIQADAKLSFKSSAKQRFLQLQAQVNMQQYKQNQVAGFNIYRKAAAENTYMQINKNGLIFPGKNGELNFYDEAFSANTLYAYAFAPVSYFGTEGARTEIIYDPAKQPKDVTPPVLRNVALPANAKGVAFAWDYAKADESEITGFVLERMTDAKKGYEAVSANISPAERNYTDNKNLANKTYYKYRLKLQTKSSQPVYSNEILLFYQTETPPPAPKNLSGKWLKENGKYYIQLSWDNKAATDTLTTGYRLYTSFPPDTALFWEGNIPLIKTNNYKYEIVYAKASKYRFAVSAINKNKDESPLSKTVEVLAPTAMMPNIKIWPFTVEQNVVTLNWKYEDLADLKSFIIYQDGKPVATLGKEARSWKSPKLEAGKNYTYELQAVSAYGAESNRSLPVNIAVDKTNP